MKLHPNAKTTPRSRAEIVSQVLERKASATEVAEAFAISIRTVWKWVRRFRLEGAPGLLDRSSRPASIPAKTSPDRELRILKLRRQRRVAWQIAKALRMARSTVSAVLKRLGLPRLKLLEPKPEVIRYQREHPGDLLHVDIKKLGRFNHVGHRIHGDRARRGRHVGWDHVYVAVDDATRLAYVEMLQEETADTAAGFLQRCIAAFASLSVRVREVMTDNGMCFRSHLFRGMCHEHKAGHITTRPYHPQSNGKAERFIQTLMREWAYAKPYATADSRARALAPWLRHYNHSRPHGSLDGITPLAALGRMV